MAQCKNGQPEHAFVKIYTIPNTVRMMGEIALIKSLLDSGRVPYYIAGENVGTLYGFAGVLNPLDVMVREDYAQDARELLRDFIDPPK
jgi:hypothetical protein